MFPKMARFVLVLLFAGVVMGAAPAQLATWLEKSAGLKGQKLMSAISICEAEDVETVADLRILYDNERLERLGFKQMALVHIEQALTLEIQFSQRGQRGERGDPVTAGPAWRRKEKEEGMRASSTAWYQPFRNRHPCARTAPPSRLTPPRPSSASAGTSAQATTPGMQATPATSA
eukprot:SAG22_NODE_1403_length_4492_cov_13.784430_2_plen_175_part_00